MKVEYIMHMGDDLSVANIARVSFAKESKEFTYKRDVAEGSDEGIIKYLATHNHWTPFSHPHITLRVGAPIPIRTQLFKHKVGLTENEESRRYIKTTPELYIPDCFRNVPSGSIKQGSDGVHPKSDYYKLHYEIASKVCIDLYEEMISNGVAPEQARFILPQGCVVNWIWTGSLSAYARVYKQRIDPHAQKEVQLVAKEIDKIIRPLFPVCWEALTKNDEEQI